MLILTLKLTFALLTPPSIGVNLQFDFLVNFSERLELALNRARLDKGELAAATGKHPSAISRWLRGSVPDFDNAQALADALNVSVHWLLTGNGPQDVTRYPLELPPTSTLQEPLMPYNCQPPSDQNKNPLLNRTLAEIQARLEELTTADAPRRALIRNHITRRIEEFEELLPYVEKDNDHRRH